MKLKRTKNYAIFLGHPVVLIELLSLGVTAEALRATIDKINRRSLSNAVNLTQNFRQKVSLPMTHVVFTITVNAQNTLQHFHGGGASAPLPLPAGSHAERQHAALQRNLLQWNRDLSIIQHI